MKILITCIHYPVASGRYIARAFKRLGHDVKSYGPYTGNGIWGMQVDPRHIWMPDYEPGDDWQPDLSITADSAYQLDMKFDCPKVLWGVDNHVRDYADYQDYDAMFFSHSWGQRMTEANTYWLPAAYDPECHYDLGDMRPVDVGFIGVIYPERNNILKAIVEAGIGVAVTTGLLWEDYNVAYNRCKIAFVKSVCGDLTQRFLENMAQGCCVLADETIDAGKLNFMPGIDYMPYRSTLDAVGKVKSLLATGDYKHIAAAGKEKAKPHTWDARAQFVIDTIGLK